MIICRVPYLFLLLRCLSEAVDFRNFSSISEVVEPWLTNNLEAPDRVSTVAMLYTEPPGVTAFCCPGDNTPFVGSLGRTVMSLDTRFLGLSKCLGVTCSYRSTDETTFAIDSTTASNETILDIKQQTHSLHSAANFLARAPKTLSSRLASRN